MEGNIYVSSNSTSGQSGARVKNRKQNCQQASRDGRGMANDDDHTDKSDSDESYIIDSKSKQNTCKQTSSSADNETNGRRQNGQTPSRGMANDDDIVDFSDSDDDYGIVSKSKRITLKQTSSSVTNNTGGRGQNGHGGSDK